MPKARPETSERSDTADTIRPRMRGKNQPKRALSPSVALVLVASCAAVSWGILTSLGWIGRPEAIQLRIATGPVGGVYYPLGRAFADALRSHFPAASIEVRSTAGSRENMRLLRDGDVDLAFAQDDTPLTPSARSIAVLHEEVMHVLVRRDDQLRVAGIGDLRGLRIALGESGSGSEVAARNMLAHFGIGAEDFEAVALPPREIHARFVDGSIDAAFVLSAMPAAAVDESCRAEVARLLTIGDGTPGTTAADGLAAVDPRFHKTLIPALAYGPRQSAAIHTVGVHAVLLCTPNLDEDLVTTITRILFQSRARLAESHPVAYQLHDRFDSELLRYPPHQGAIAYYRRNEPAFVVEYAETIGLCITIMIGIASGGAALRQWMRRRRKERIDLYYQRVIDATVGLSTATESRLLEMLDALEQLRRAAFADLVREKLTSNESFTIFQDFVAAEVEVISNRLERMRA